MGSPRKHSEQYNPLVMEPIFSMFVFLNKLKNKKYNAFLRILCGHQKYPVKITSFNLNHLYLQDNFIANRKLT